MSDSSEEAAHNGADLRVFLRDSDEDRRALRWLSRRKTVVALARNEAERTKSSWHLMDESMSPKVWDKMPLA